MKRYFVTTNADNMVLFVDDNNNAVYIDETAFDEPLTLDVAKRADYSNFDGCETAEEATANYADGEHLIHFDPDDETFEKIIEF